MLSIKQIKKGLEIVKIDSFFKPFDSVLCYSKKAKKAV